MAQGRKVLAANLWGIDDESAATELASSPDLLEARVLLKLVRGLPPWGAPSGCCGVTPRQHDGGHLPLGPVVLGLVALWACGGMCAVRGARGWLLLPLMLCTAPPNSTRVGLAGSTHGGHQPPPYAWKHPLLGLGFVATLLAVRMTGGCANAFG
jgi:hypothetical protein